MKNPIKKHLQNIAQSIGLGYRMVRGLDYQALCLYILKINQQKDIDAILFEISKCLKDILDYELFGFALKNGNATDIWIDPDIYTAQFAEHIAVDCKCHKNDLIIHKIDKTSSEKRQDFDTIDTKNLLTYSIEEINFIARLYILPKRRMLRHHHTIISTITKSVSAALEKNLNTQQLENAATIDPLTDCYNRRALCDFIESDIAYTQRYGTELSIVMIDLDNFKEMNDMYGHLAGDAVLKEMSSLIISQVRKSDYLARYGGEEFVMVLPDTPLYSAVQLADKIRKTMEKHTIIFGKKRLRVTASFGVASLEDKPDHGSLLREADERLYKAKAMGKNCVVPSLLPCFADRNFVSKKRIRKYAGAANLS